MAFEHLISKLGYMRSQERRALAMYGVLPSVTRRVQTLNVKLPHAEETAETHPAAAVRQMVAAAVSGGRPTFTPPKHGIPAAKASGPTTPAATPVAMPSPAAAAVPRNAVAMPSAPRGGARPTVPGTRPVSMPSGASRTSTPQPQPSQTIAASGGPPGKPHPGTASDSSGAPAPPMPSSSYTDSSTPAPSGDYSSDAATASASMPDVGSDGQPTSTGSGWKWIVIAAGVFVILRRM